MMSTCVLLFFAVFLFTANSSPISQGLHTSKASVVNIARSLKQKDPRLDLQIDEDLDLILSQIDDFIIDSGLDPFRIPDIHHEFQFEFLFIKYHGYLNLTSAWLQDIATMHRADSADVNVVDTYATISLPLAFNDFVLNGNYDARLMGLGPDGTIDANIKDIMVLAELEVNFSPIHVQMNKFKISKIGDISVKLHGNLSDILVNILTDVVTFLFHDLIVGIAEGIVSDQINVFIDGINDMLTNGTVTIPR